jgi:hypothetical protein
MYTGIKEVTWMPERIEKSGSGGLIYRYRRYGYARFLLVPSRRFRVKMVRVAELDKKKTSWAPNTKYEKIGAK